MRSLKTTKLAVIAGAIGATSGFSGEDCEMLHEKVCEISSPAVRDGEFLILTFCSFST
jgi:hypothetical protein